jgi:hypothetical protein
MGNIFEDGPSPEPERQIDWKKVITVIIVVLLIVVGAYAFVTMGVTTVSIITGTNNNTAGNALSAINGSCILPAVNDTAKNPICNGEQLVGVIDPTYGCYGPFSVSNVTKAANLTLTFTVANSPVTHAPLNVLVTLQNSQTHQWLFNYNTFDLSPAHYLLQPGQYRFAVLNCNHVPVQMTINATIVPLSETQ